ncbi:MAG: threonylcarbamoyl-AMP synthase [Deltaproteobacteria bacterium]|nr:threonylcarbamoyl-AMP synthase [Deltaproteobacteria bacterium]
MARARAPLLAISAEHPEPHRIRQAVARLKDEEAVVYPTDTIYGLAVDLESRGGVDRLYSLRRLDPRKPLSVVCGSLSEASRYAVLDNDCYRFMRRVLPGPYTFVLRATREVPRTGDQRRRAVGIRIPAHPVALALVAELGRPLLSTSAILDTEDGEGRVSDPVALAERYGDGVALVLDAGILEGTPSSVVDWTEDGPRVLRVGAGDVSELL